MWNASALESERLGHFDGTTTTLNGFSFNYSVAADPTTPLPATLPLFGGGLGALGLLGWRRKRKAQAVA
jgi:hypothetical protein